MKKLSILTLVAFAILLAVPALAADRTITNGIDLWVTRGNGSTFGDFSKESIPAGFFCNKSEPFTGKVVFRGVPIVTGQPGFLGATDTIVQRLDDAVFNTRGVAKTRVQVKAMQFESVAPLDTACGSFNVYLKLDGEQPVTTMRIVRDNENGGRFYAPIWVNIKMTFEPIGHATTEAFEIRKSLRFPAAPNAQWAASHGNVRSAFANGFIKVDTDGDGVPDTFLPGTSNFLAGHASRPQKSAAPPVCHVADDGMHCPDPGPQP